MLPAIGNRFGFAVQTVRRALTVFSRADGVGSVSQLLVPYLWLDRELGKFKVLGPCADCYSPLEQCTSLQASILLMHDGAGLDSGALLLPTAEDELFGFLTCLFLFHIASS